MNTNTTIDFYPAEIAYRRERMLSDRAPMRRWLGARRTSKTLSQQKHAR